MRRRGMRRSSPKREGRRDRTLHLWITQGGGVKPRLLMQGGGNTGWEGARLNLTRERTPRLPTPAGEMPGQAGTTEGGDESLACVNRNVGRIPPPQPLHPQPHPLLLGKLFPLTNDQED
jgi:hypothetical protein